MKRIKKILKVLAGVEVGFFTGCFVGCLSLEYFQRSAFDLGYPWGDAVWVGCSLEGTFLGIILVIPLLRVFIRRYFEVRL